MRGMDRVRRIDLRVGFVRRRSGDAHQRLASPRGSVAARTTTELHATGGGIDGAERCSRCRCRPGGTVGERLLEAVDAIEQRSHVGGRCLVGELHQRHFEQQALVRRVTHLDEHLAQPLHRPHGLARTQPAGLLGDRDGLGVGERHELGRHQRQEAVAQGPDDVLGERPGITTLMHGVRRGGERPAGVELDQRLDELAEVDCVELVAAGGGHQLERAERVTGRPGPLLECRLDGSVTDLQACVGHHPTDVRLELVHGQEVEPEVLRAAADRVADFLRIGGRQHEHHVRWRLLERLQQRCLGLFREHVHLVEDVHLVPAGCAE